MPGKLNGVMAATTPNGWRIKCSSMPVAMSSLLEPCISMGMPHAVSTLSMARRISPTLSVSLAALIGDGARQVVEILFEQGLEFEQRLDTFSGRSAPPTGEGARGALGGLMHLRRRRERHLGEHLRRRRVEHLQRLCRAGR